jgi:hypothetical protein
VGAGSAHQLDFPAELSVAPGREEETFGKVLLAVSSHCLLAIAAQPTKQHS